MGDQQRNVFAPFVQRRQDDVYDIQSIIEVFAECALAHHGLQIPVSCRQYAHIHADGIGAADRTYLVLLQNAQQFHLQPHRHVADFVQQQRTSLGGLEESLMIASSAGERSAGVTKEFRLEQLLGHG